MAATVAVIELNGTKAAWTETTISGAGVGLTARYCTADSAAPGLNNPLPIPTAGQTRSYWKSHLLQFTGTFTQISNIEWYTDGTLGWNVGTGGHVSIGWSGGAAAACPSGDYEQATGTPGTIGDTITGHHYFNASGHAFALTSGSPLTVQAGTITVPGHYSRIVVTQCGITSDATSGTQTAEQYTWEYDEIS